MAGRAGVEPTTLRLKVIDATNAPPRPPDVQFCHISVPPEVKGGDTMRYGIHMVGRQVQEGRLEEEWQMTDVGIWDGIGKEGMA